MATATMTLIGMYNYDNSLFDKMTLPDGIDKETLINSLLMKSGEFEVLYPNVDFMRDLIGVWSDKWQRTMTEWLRGTRANWNPIENYDRYEDSTVNRTAKGKATGKDTFESTGSNSALVSAYDSSELQPSAQNNTVTNNNSTSSSDTESTGSDSTVSHIHGNIGVTQSSDMLRSFYDIATWNLYDHISDLFIAEMCIPVY